MTVVAAASSRRFLDDVRSSLRRPAFWTFSGWLEIITRYRKTRLGVLWMVIPPACFIVVLGYAYAGLMGYPLARYLPHLALGYALWRLLIQVLNESMGSLRNHKAFIMQGRITLTDYIFKAVAKSLLYFIAAMLVVLAVLLWSPQVPAVGLLTLLITVPVFVANAVWLAIVAAIVGARVPDATEAIGAILIFAFLLTPILWLPEQAPVASLQGKIMRLNPAFHLLEVVRAPALGHTPEAISIAVVAGMTVVGIGLAAWIYRRYARVVPLWL